MAILSTRQGKSLDEIVKNDKKSFVVGYSDLKKNIFIRRYLFGPVMRINFYGKNISVSLEGAQVNYVISLLFRIHDLDGKVQVYGKFSST